MHPYRPLGAFRFLLAFLVMLQHFAAHAAAPWLALALQPYEPGSVAVLAFFALSGFVIAQAVEDHYGERAGAFLENRALRILPHFFIAMTLVIVFSWLFSVTQGTAFSARNIVLNFFSILPGVEWWMDYAFIPIVWAIRVEVIFYLVIAGSVWFGKKARMKWQRCELFAMVPLLVLYALALCGLAPAMFGFVPYFAYGVAIYFAFQGSKRACLLAGAALMGMELHFLSQPVVHGGFVREVGAQNLLLLLLIALMTLLARLHSTKHKTLDSNLGAMTYPLYLYHYLVLVAVMHGMGVGFTGGMAASIVLAVIMTWAVEKPLMRLRAQIRTKRAS